MQNMQKNNVSNLTYMFAQMYFSITKEDVLEDFFLL